MLNNSYFPIKWKETTVVILPKKDKAISDPKTLRAITLLPNISKIFEIHIINNLNNFCKDRNLICEKQLGFKYKCNKFNNFKHQLELE